MRLEPELAHRRALQLLQVASRLPGSHRLLGRYAPDDDPVTLCGLRFPNRLGLAAGYDKDAVAVSGLAALGFGHLELGTVTLRAQPGNAGVRIVRLPEHGALVNRLGFPGLGVDAFVRSLNSAQRHPTAILGANLGKNHDTPNEEAGGEYAQLLERVAGVVDYVTVNVSSPNTAGLRNLQDPAHLTALLTEVCRRRDQLGKPLPVWVKISPDVDQPGELAKRIEGVGCDAIVVANTTLSRPVATPALGGLSGRPLGPLALATLEAVRGASALPLVAVGGVHDAEGYRSRLEAGATLVQLYTALVYQGPVVLRRVTG